MANVVDTLVTRLVLDGDQYKKGSADVLAGTEKLVVGLGAARSGIGSLLGRLQQLAQTGLAVGAGLIGLGVAAGTGAVKAAISFDTIQRSLEAVTKSAERAKEILAFDDKLAGPSIFSSEDLASASLTLEAFKLTTERFLPVAEKLGTIFGSDKAALDSFVTSLGYLKNGRYGEGFESLARAGLSKQDFQDLGLRFDKGGEFQGSAEDALNAVEKLVNERFGKLSELMASGPAAKLASVMDAVGRAARVAGGAILSFLVPAADKVGNFVTYLVDSGKLQTLADSFAKLFDGDKIGDTLIKGFNYLVAVIQDLPSMIDTLANNFKTQFNEIRLVVIKLASFMAALFVGETIVKGIALIIDLYKTLTTVIKGAAVAQALLTALTGAGILVVGAALAAMVATAKALDSAIPKFGRTETSGAPNTIVAEAERNQADFEKWAASNNKGPTGAANAIVNTLVSTLTSPLQATADNTKRSAVASEKLAADIQTQLFGGSTQSINVTGSYGLSKITGAGRSGGRIGRLLQELGGLIEAQTTSGAPLEQRARMNR